jgi:hypothetical protein
MAGGVRRRRPAFFHARRRRKPMASRWGMMPMRQIKAAAETLAKILSIPGAFAGLFALFGPHPPKVAAGLGALLGICLLLYLVIDGINQYGVHKWRGRHWFHTLYPFAILATFASAGDYALRHLSPALPARYEYPLRIISTAILVIYLCIDFGEAHYHEQREWISEEEKHTIWMLDAVGLIFALVLGIA